MHYFFNKD